MSRDTDRIPKRIRQALSDSSLILLGYDLRSWEFRTLFWGLIKFRPPIKQENVSVQVAPDDTEKLYLDKYLSEARFRVVWRRCCSMSRNSTRAWERKHGRCRCRPHVGPRTFTYAERDRFFDVNARHRICCHWSFPNAWYCSTLSLEQEKAC